MTMGYKKNDIVVVISTQSSSKKDKYSYSFCKVFEVGKHDLICKSISKYSIRDSFFIVSKKRCIKVDHNKMPFDEAKVIRPSIGDLVVCVSTDYKSDEVRKIAGILESIHYDPSKNIEEAVVRMGQITETVDYKNLIILGD